MVSYIFYFATEPEERQLNYSFDISTNDRQSVGEQETTYTTDSVNMNQYQEKAKETVIQYSDIPESKNDESIQGEEAQKEDDLSKQNDNDSDIEYKGEETQTKKGF